MANDKRKDIKQDASEKYDEVSRLLDTIKDFCIIEKRKNSFLVEIDNTNKTFKQIQELIALRVLHILNKGFIPKKVGHQYMALMLDYGFYVNTYVSRSVDLFSKDPQPLQAQELRQLPTFKME